MGAPTALAIRRVPAAAVDLVRFATLVNSAFATHPHMEADRTSPTALAEELGDTGEMLAIEDDHELIACAFVRPATDVFPHAAGMPAGFVVPGALYFGLAAVAPARMSRGLGRRLVREAEACARARGFERVVLSTLREHGLVPYYSGQGYVPVGHTDFEAGHWGVTVPHRLCYFVKDVTETGAGKPKEISHG